MTESTLENTIEDIISTMTDRIEDVDESIVAEVIGVSQAIGQLRKALDKLDNLLDKRKFSEACQLGYDDIASEFIFLQRTLGGLQDIQHKLEN